VKYINKYIGKYRVFQEIDLESGKASKNTDDTYLKTKYKSQIYRYDDNTLAILFVTSKSPINILPQLKKLNINVEMLSEGDSESIYLFDEKDIKKVASILKPQIKGKNISSKSVKTSKKLMKENVV
jgi:hypothetical protein